MYVALYVTGNVTYP